MYSLMFRSPPYRDELLSSWLARLAKLNYLTLTGFLNTYFKEKRYSKYDLDLYLLNNQFFEKLSKLTNIKISKIKNLQLMKYEGYIEEKIYREGRHHWFTPAHTYSKKGKFYGIRFCPECLKEKIYFKDIWRIMFINVCPQHKCYLLNFCPKCHANIDYTRVTYNSQLYNCHMCSFDLRLSKSIKIASLKKMLFQKKLTLIYKKGYYMFQDKWHYSFGLFYILRIVTRNIMRIDNTINEKFIEKLLPQELNLIINKSMKLLDNFPEKLMEFRKENKLTKESVFFDKYKVYKKYTPHWFTNNQYFIEI